MKIPLDKQLHFLGSALLMCMGYILLGSIVYASGIALSIGLAKESIWDYYLAKGTPDVNDMIANCIGVVFATMFIYFTIGIS